MERDRQLSHREWPTRADGRNGANRYLRKQKGKVDAAEGKARNKCGLCGQIKKGHICTGSTSVVESDLVTQQQAHAQARSELPIAPARLALGSPIALSFGDSIELYNQQQNKFQNPVVQSHPQSPDERNMSSLFAPLPSIVTADATVAFAPAPAAAKSGIVPCWSPATSQGDVAPSPDITAASLLAPTPEGMVPGSYTFPVAMAAMPIENVE